MLLALPGHPRRLLALGIAGAVTAVVLAPIVLAGMAAGGSGSTLVTAAATTGQIFHPWHVFWFLGDNAPGLIGYGGLPLRPGFRAAPEWLMPLTHPLIVALVVPLSLGWARAHRALPRLGGEQLLLLLALLLLLRCVLDPWNAVYYELPFLLALLCWEALCRPGRPPVLALGATLANWLTFEYAPDVLSPDMQCAFFLAWSLPLVAWLGREAFFASPARRERREQGRVRARRRPRYSASERRRARYGCQRADLGGRRRDRDPAARRRARDVVSTPALRVRGKGMCRLRKSPDALVLRVVDMGEREALLQGAPDVFFSTPHYDGWPYVLVRLEAVDPVELAELLEDAWRGSLRSAS